MTVLIPLAAIPSQSLNINLNNQACSLSVYQLSTGLFLDLSVNGVPVVTCRACPIATPLIRASYNGFVGEFVFVDVVGESNPNYTGFGTRWFLTYG